MTALAYLSVAPERKKKDPPSLRGGCRSADAGTREAGGVARDPVRPYSALAISRSRNFWILPVDVFGTSLKTTVFGTLKRARRSRHHAVSSSAVAVCPALSSTKAHGVSPHF